MIEIYNCPYLEAELPPQFSTCVFFGQMLMEFDPSAQILILRIFVLGCGLHAN